MSFFGFGSKKPADKKPEVAKKPEKAASSPLEKNFIKDTLSRREKEAGLKCGGKVKRKK